jgi:hypothetical protein
VISTGVRFDPVTAEMRNSNSRLIVRLVSCLFWFQVRSL